MRLKKGRYYWIMHRGKKIIGKYYSTQRVYDTLYDLMECPHRHLLVFKLRENILKEAEDWEVPLYLLGSDRDE